MSIVDMETSNTRILHNRYRLLSVLGKGGQATIYRALDQALDTERAIKLLSPENMRQERSRSRFQQEAKVMAQIVDKGIVQIYDIVYTEQYLCIVMELINGGNLWQWVKTHGKMPEHMACITMRNVLKTLQVIHQNGIIHRDIKPQNMMLTEQGEIKLTDFGIAQSHQQLRLTQTGLVVGTLGYIAPEQMEDSKNVTFQSDLYAIGATLYALCQAKKPNHLFLAHHNKKRLNNFSPALRKIILRACHYELTDRYASAQEMIDDIERILPKLPATPPHTPSLAVHASQQTTAEQSLDATQLQDFDTCVFGSTQELSIDETEDSRTKPSETADTVALSPTVPTTPKPRKRKRVLISLLVLGLAVVILLLTRETTVDLQQTLQPICQQWQSKLVSQQHPNGGFSGLPQVYPAPWDTGQQLAALHFAKSCETEPDTVFVQAIPLLHTWLQDPNYPQTSYGPAWLLIALDNQVPKTTQKIHAWLQSFRLPDGSYKSHLQSQKSDPYATLLAAWALYQQADAQPSDELTQTLQALASMRSNLLTAGVDEQTWWFLQQLQSPYDPYKPSLQDSISFAQRIIARCKATSPSEPCSVPTWPTSKQQLSNHGQSAGVVVFQGEPWIFIAAYFLQKHPLPTPLKTQVEKIFQWSLQQRINSSSYMLSSPGFQLSENLLTTSLVVHDLSTSVK